METIYARQQPSAQLVFRPPQPESGGLFDITIANVDGNGNSQYIQVFSTNINIFMVSPQGEQVPSNNYIRPDGTVDFSQLYFLKQVEIAIYSSTNQTSDSITLPAILTGYVSNQVYINGPITVDPRYVFTNDYISTITALSTVYNNPNVLATVDPPQVYFQGTSVVINDFLNVFGRTTAAKLSPTQADAFLVEYVQTMNVNGIVFVTMENNTTAYIVGLTYPTLFYSESPFGTVVFFPIPPTMLQFVFQINADGSTLVEFREAPSLPPPVDPVTQACRRCFKKCCKKKRH